MGLADGVVPLGGWRWAGDDRRRGWVAIPEDRQDVATRLVLEWRGGPIIDERYVHARDQWQGTVAGSPTDYCRLFADRGPRSRNRLGPILVRCSDWVDE